MGAAFVRIDIIREAEYLLCVSFMILERHIDDDSIFFLDKRDNIMERHLILVQELDK